MNSFHRSIIAMLEAGGELVRPTPAEWHRNHAYELRSRTGGYVCWVGEEVVEAMQSAGLLGADRMPVNAHAGKVAA